MRPLLALAIFVVTGVPAFGEVVSLKEADLPGLVRANNHLIKSTGREVQGLQEKTGSLERSFIPTLELYGAQERFKIGSSDYYNEPELSARLSLNLYNGGKDQLKGQIEDLELEQGKARHFVNSLDQLEETRKTYWNAVFYRDLITKYEKLLKLIGTNQKAAQRRINSGVATTTDLFEFQLKSQEVLQEKHLAALAFEKYVGHLKVLLGLSQSAQVEVLEKLERPENWKQLVSHSEQDHDFLLEETRLEVDRSKKVAQLGNAGWLPSLDAYALWTQQNQKERFGVTNVSDRRETTLGISAQWKMSEIFESRAQSRAAREKSLSARQKLIYQQKEVEHEIHMELRELELLDSLLSLANESIKKSEQYLKQMRGDYKRGVKSSGDMLAATDTLIHAEIRRMKLIRDFQMAKAHILKKFGR